MAEEAGPAQIADPIPLGGALAGGAVVASWGTFESEIGSELSVFVVGPDRAVSYLVLPA